jgi:glutaryl-CoA dehydrogenase
MGALSCGPAVIGSNRLSTATRVDRHRASVPNPLGANGLTLEYPVKRHATNLESVLTYEGSSESPDDH